jgi:hypothetical protein
VPDERGPGSGNVRQNQRISRHNHAAAHHTHLELPDLSECCSLSENRCVRGLLGRRRDSDEEQEEKQEEQEEKEGQSEEGSDNKGN